MIAEIKTEKDILDAIRIVLKPTTSRQKRNNYLTGIHRCTDYDPYVLDAYFDYALNSRRIDASDFLPKLNNFQNRLDAKIPEFLKEIAKEALPKIDLELINFYENNKYGDKAFAECLSELYDSKMLFFEISTEWPIDDYTTPKHFRMGMGKKINENHRKYEYFLDSADVIILYHATSTVFDSKIKTNGLQPPVKTGIIPDPELRREEIIERLGIEKFEHFKKSYEESRKFSVYLSTGNGEMFTNGDVYNYMERTVEKFGGNGRIYRCVVPKKILLPDEDAKDAKDWIDSINLMNSAKINGGIDKEGIFVVEEKSYPFRRDEKSPTALEIEGLFRSNYHSINLYLAENPIEQILRCC